MPEPVLFHRLTPVLFVDRVAPCLPFWTDRLGFQTVAEVPRPDGQPQFAMLVRDGLELMYQTRASLKEELPEEASTARGRSVSLFIEVQDLDAIERALGGVPRIVERHTTIYGMDEFTMREPGGSLVTFAMKAA